MKFAVHSTCVDIYACKGKELKAQISSFKTKVSAYGTKPSITAKPFSSAQKQLVHNAKHPPICHHPRTAALPQ